MVYERQQRWRRKQVEEANDIGDIPLPEDLERRERCRYDLLAFLVEYFPESTGISEFSDEHKDAILRMQYAILEGGSVVLTCFPRGFGKTTISENVAIWIGCYGHRRFVPFIGADKGAATDNIESLKTEFTTNELLIADFPEVCLPYIHLENKSQRCRTQTHRGELTHIRWSAEEIGSAWIRDVNGEYLPNVGVIYRCLGITGRLRGMSTKLPDGRKQRPDFFILDDPQTDESALSPAQCDKRMSIYQKSILRLGGHTKLLSGVINATVIEPDDMIDSMLSMEEHPEIEGVRIPMLKEFATNSEMWLEQYKDIRTTYNPEDPRDRRRAINDANKFYADNFEAMNEGAKATWVHCFASEEGELSAIQHAYNILIDDGERVFSSECQNQPIGTLSSGISIMVPSEIVKTRVGEAKNFPAKADTIGVYIDVQKRALYYCVTAVAPDFTIYPIDYGTYPEQKNGKMVYADVRQTLQRKYPGKSDEQIITAAVCDLLTNLSARKYLRMDGVELSPDMLIVDGGYQTEAVHDGVKLSGLRNAFVGHGRGLRAADTPMLQLARKRGERRSKDPFIPWRQLINPNRRGSRHVLICTNSLKTFVHRRINTEPGAPGSFELRPGDHRYFLGAVCSSESPTETEGPFGRTVEWAAVPGNPDNHLFDCLCGSLVAASMTGRVSFSGLSQVATTTPNQERRKVKYL